MFVLGRGAPRIGALLEASRVRLVGASSRLTEKIVAGKMLVFGQLNTFRGSALNNNIPLRMFSLSAVASKEKYFKILKYAKPVDTKKYKEGDSLKGVAVMPFKPKYPVYEYEAMFFKRQNRGLYGGLQRKRSKSCSESGNKNLRAHRPNIVKTKLWSETLNKSIQTRVSTKVLKTITREGGLDRYLTKDKPARIKTLGLKGWKLRYDVLKKKEEDSLPFVNKDGKQQKVWYVHPDGRNFIVGRQKLLRELYEYTRRDSYRPLEWRLFLSNHSYLTFKEVVDKLEGYNYDFSVVTA